MAELPFACEFCSARYKTKPGLQYHLAKHKEANSEHRSASSNTDISSSTAVQTNAQASMMKQKYATAPINDQHLSQQQQHQHSMYSNHPPPTGIIL